MNREEFLKFCQSDEFRAKIGRRVKAAWVAQQTRGKAAREAALEVRADESAVEWLRRTAHCGAGVARSYADHLDEVQLEYLLATHRARTVRAERCASPRLFSAGMREVFNTCRQALLHLRIPYPEADEIARDAMNYVPPQLEEADRRERFRRGVFLANLACRRTPVTEDATGPAMAQERAA